MYSLDYSKVLLLQLSNLMLNMVGVGLLLWNQTRQQWIGTKKPNIHTQQLREPKIRFVSFKGLNLLFHSFFKIGGSVLRAGYPHHTILSIWSVSLLGNALCIFGCNEQEMIDFLADIWEQEGLYD
ncbi:hypothetical protein C3L33_14582, partial [Rhododendron williamsianum]